ncbi:ras association domain-containing protein 8 [Archocentrus centrarchus]|uniref:ras association domain-containing protein 8 n=1 Tax=Archocentrus centrarchus TaxID=63155 RepID=UPI0011EA38C7|nr:ras association domain-containing protein 8-like [Archocentrus centrarchus]XP_030587681.1 ras association domain-containing protein 8-like [Archocentrus centrarchus]XP_030587683.1 ras association domain-containing protein 8-like [Archocentrus centrarchus]XP_030587684.1 ras association domain-containing protein 8-like [Archocentrus centrarchus]
MELKVWVDGVQRVVCGVTEATTCQEVVIALAQAIGRTGRYTLVEKWRDTERHLAPHESPVASLNTWGQYAGDVQLILHRTGPSLTERPPSEGPPLRGPERGLHRQSLPPLAKLRHPNDRSLRRREPRRKSLTFTGAPRSLREILSGGRIGEAEAKRRLLLGNGGSIHHVGPTIGTASPSLWACRMEDLVRLVGLQRETLNVLEKKLEAYEAELQAWAEGRGGRGEGCAGNPGVGGLIEEILRLEKHLKKNEVEMEEEEFWATELQIELESERQLEERLQELRGRLQSCELEIEEKLAMVQGVEAGLEEEKLQRERRETQWVSEAEARAQVLRVKTELKAQERQAVQLESSCKAVDRSLGQSSKKLQDMQHELEQLTKELRQVNLQQFIKQTGTKVTVLPAEPAEEGSAHNSPGIDLVPLSGSLKRPVSTHPGPSHLRVLHSPLSSGLNPEGIYV